MVTPAARATTSTEVPAIDALEGPDRLRAGWSVQDLVSQLSSLFWVVVDPSVLPDTAGLPTERAQDVCVEARRDWSPQRVLDDHEVVSAKALDALRAIEPQDVEMPLGDLGTFHASVLPTAYMFDHSPTSAPTSARRVGRCGPHRRRRAPARADHRLDRQRGATAERGGPRGPRRRDRDRRPGYGGPDVPARRRGTVAHVSCSGHSLVLWSTQRAGWDDLDVEATGEEGALAVAQRLHVF